MCACVFEHACVYLCVFVCTCACLCVSIYVSVCICVCACVSICMPMCSYVCACVYLYMSVCVFVCVYPCMDLCASGRGMLMSAELSDHSEKAVDQGRPASGTGASAETWELFQHVWAGV